MKKLLMVFAAIVMMGGFWGKVMAQDSEVAHAYAKIITQITITSSSDLNFGTMAKGVIGGTCIIDESTGNRTQTGTVVLSSQGPTAQRATFVVAGEALTTYTITFATNPITISSGANQMKVSLTKKTQSGKGDGGDGKLSESGADTFWVGGTLIVGPSQVNGTYSGHFAVSVDYN